MANAIDTLRAAGVDVDQLPPEQRKVLSELSEQETEVLVSIQERLNAASGDVAGYVGVPTVGTCFW